MRWAAIEPHLPYYAAGKRREDDRRIISGIIHILQSGCRWQKKGVSAQAIGRTKGGRNTIERMFGRLKNYRRIAMRYDKNAENFMAGLCLAALICDWI